MSNAPTDVRQLLRQLVAIDSSNPDPGESKLADAITDIAQERGWSVQRYEFRSGRPNLVISVDKGGSRSVGLSGHLDTKARGADSHWETPPLDLVVDGDLAFGHGTADMKGAISAMIVALEGWSRHSDDLGLVKLILTADEENGSEFGAWELAASGVLEGLEGILIGEPSGITYPWEAVFLGCRGVACFLIEITSKQGHSALSARLPKSASVAAAQLVVALSEWKPSVPPPFCVDDVTVNPGVLMRSGVGYGVHPGYASVACDVRTVPGMVWEEVVSELSELIDRVLPRDLSAVIKREQGRRGWLDGVQAAWPEGMRSALAATDGVLGRRLATRLYPGGTDAIAFEAAAGIPCIASLGPGLLSVAHGPNEFISLTAVSEAVSIYEAFLTGLLAQ